MNPQATQLVDRLPGRSGRSTGNACSSALAGCYQRRDWSQTIQHFGAALEAAPGDQPSPIFVDRCRHYSDNPPPENWNGMWIMEQK